MASQLAAPSTLLRVALLLVSAAVLCAAGAGSLREGFYSETCPRAEEIVREAVADGLALNPGWAAGLLHMSFHDCFVRGCDASILLDATPTGEPVEKEAPANGPILRGLELIDDAKQRLESECPGTVSCADVLAFATRDALALAGMSNYPVPAGRRDGRVSRAADVPSNLLPPSASVSNATGLFASKGLSQEEMVTLLGAHSIGGAHCGVFAYRLYRYRPDQPQDPTMDPAFADLLKLRCPEEGSYFSMIASQERVPFTRSPSALALHNTFYVDLIKGMGLLESDQALMEDAGTSSLVEQMAGASRDWWAKKFGAAMVKMGSIEVLTGKDGEVRRSCRSVN
ncbi:hypothetical protein Taro_045913 [Colocasia esculenta]|uniref:Peroxidase n=1 Tax=Colocasia esculenta TaxID=4460 RepID=A0A843WNE4_COLES|nr:hypothetical protein [Colocasia esculenta]